MVNFASDRPVDMFDSIMHAPVDSIYWPGRVAVDMNFTLHHVGYAVATIESAAAFYVERYGYEIVTPIIHDPVQTAYVQFLRLKGDSAYLEFVAPDSPSSKLAKAALKGSVLNHICYAVDDIEAATNHLRETEMHILIEPVAAVAFAGRRISWLIGMDLLPIELVERGGPRDL